jgi:hypothetical protein
MALMFPMSGYTLLSSVEYIITNASHLREVCKSDCEFVDDESTSCAKFDGLASCKLVEVLLSSSKWPT